jgi:predicted alpha/beta hydrolase family esterase
MQQILFLHGGDSFSSRGAYLSSLNARILDYERLKYHPRWREWIATQLPYDDVLTPTMPNSDNAQYEEWVIYFEKIIPLLKGDFTIVGHSLGAMFLAKYLHSQTLPRKARKVILVAGRYGSSPHEDTGSFTVNSARGVEKSAHSVHLFHSVDDPVVPYEDMERFQSDIIGAQTHSFTTRGHFVDTTFPEMLVLLQQK